VLFYAPSSAAKPRPQVAVRTSSRLISFFREERSHGVVDDRIRDKTLCR
jgi:hypothetical protein